MEQTYILSAPYALWHITDIKCNYFFQKSNSLFQKFWSWKHTYGSGSRTSFFFLLKVFFSIVLKAK